MAASSAAVASAFSLLSVMTQSCLRLRIVRVRRPLSAEAPAVAVGVLVATGVAAVARIVALGRVVSLQRQTRRVVDLALLAEKNELDDDRDERDQEDDERYLRIGGEAHLAHDVTQSHRCLPTAQRALFRSHRQAASCRCRY